MSTPSDHSPGRGNDSSARIGAILASAEQEIARIVAATVERGVTDDIARIEVRTRMLDEREADLDARAEDLDLRAAELAELTAGLLSTAAVVQSHARRLATLHPLTGDASSLRRVGPASPPLDAEAPAALRAVGPAGEADPSPRPSAAAPATPGAGRPPRVVDEAPRTSVPHAAPDVPDAVLAPAHPVVPTDDGLTDPPEKLDSARLVALSMAAEGRTRVEVEAHVRDRLGIVEHATLMDYVFGDSAPASVVPGWPPRRRRRSS